MTLSGGEQISCRVAVNAAGPHGQSINALADPDGKQRIRTRVVRHEVKIFAVQTPRPVMRPASCCTTPTSGVTSGRTPATAFLPGSLGARGKLSWQPIRMTSIEISPRKASSLYRLAQRIPTLGIPNTLSGVADLWDVSDDWIPIYDCTDVAGFYMAIGTSGNQFKTAPVVGELMTALISACEQGTDHDQIQSRSGCNAPAIRSISDSSRNREPNPASSLSVLG